MRAHLAVRVEGIAEDRLWFYLPGQWLLTETQNAVDRWELQATKITGAATTKSSPLALTKAADWRKAVVSMRSFRGKDYYFKVGKRTIKKWAWGSSSGGHADGYYMSDVALSGTDPVKPSESNRIWTRTEGASYREFAKFMADCMPLGRELEWSEQVTQELRSVMAGTVDYSAKKAGDYGSALPLLATVMFVAEPARNKRAWPIGLMMLDLIGQQYNIYSPSEGAKYYTWPKVLAHPERIDPGYKASASVDKPQKGPTSRSSGLKGAPLGLGPLSLKKQLASVEGKLPASPSGSASTGSTINVAQDYIQMKELSLLVRWLQKRLHAAHKDDDAVLFCTWPASEPLDGLTDLTRDCDLETLASSVKIAASALKKVQADVQKEIKDLLYKRCSELGAM